MLWMCTSETRMQSVYFLSISVVPGTTDTQRGVKETLYSCDLLRFFPLDSFA